jgi:PAS domain S-box-containing protein
MENARLAAIVESSTDAIIGKTTEGVVTDWNHAAERMFGYTAAEAVGRTVLDLIVPMDHQNEEVEILARVTRGETVPHFHTKRRRHDGSRFDVAVTVSPIHGADGRIIGASKIIRDISEQKAAEQRLVDLNTVLQARTRDAEAATMAKSQFLANVSHEIRSPMNAILGMLQLLRDTDLSDIQRTYAANALAATRSLLGLLNDLLDFSKIEAEKMELERHPFSIEAIIRELATVLAGSKTNDAVELQLLVDPRLTAQLQGDGYRLRQILLNLGGNAIKFTEKGEVVISIQIAGRTAEHTVIDFAISDTGIGIASDRLTHIFASFSQGESSTTRRYGGTGLGLTISQRLVGMMGGTLAVESQPGVGSRFYFTLTFPNANEGADEAETSPAAAATSERLPRILIIDTPHSARRALLDMAQALGWQAHSITGGTAALAALAKPGNARLYDIIFVDWGLSEPGAVETTRQIRQFWHLRETPIIAVISPYSRKSVGDELRANPTLLNGFLVKPFTASMVFDAMVDVTAGQAAPGTWKRNQARAAELRPRIGPRLAGLRLLVVEDNMMNQMVARELLTKEGAVVDVAGGGLAGVQQATSKYLSYDAVLMDIQMPDLDGYDATRKIRQDKDRRSLPVIAMTANAMASDKAACLEAGMDDHIAKPIDLDVVVETLLRHCPSARQLSANDENLAGPPPAPVSDSDVEMALQRMGGNTSLFIRLAGQFVIDAPAMHGELQRHLQDGAWSKATATLHTLKGMAATVGANRLADFSSKLELDLKSDCPPEDIACRLPEMQVLVSASSLMLKTTIAAFAGQQTAPGRPANRGALAAMLDELETLLESADMRATAVYEDLRLEWDSDLDDQIVTLGSAINRLDFSTAAVECRAIRSIVR